VDIDSLFIRLWGYCHYDESTHGDGKKNRPKAVFFLVTFKMVFAAIFKV